MADIYTVIQEAVTNAAGLSINAKLVALNGSNHILPPTYADAPLKHNMTPPDGTGLSAWVSIDSAASFANRVEERLVHAGLGLDPLRVAVAGRNLSTMQMPHRAYDAILRDSELDGIAFRKTDIGKAVIAASVDDASALLKYDPSILLLGGWNSTGLGENKGHVAKWPAALSVEITGTGARPVDRAGGRLDPLGITLDAGRMIREDDSYHLVPEGEKPPKEALRPSEINHGNIAPTASPKGVLVDEIQLAGSLSFARLRRYNFGDEEADRAAWTFLACMGIYGVAAELEDGLDLRRDCELVADDVSWTIRRPGGREPITVSKASAREALEQARENIELSQPVEFEAGDNLEQLVARSQ